CLVSSLSLYADIEEYFKKIAEKSGYHAMRNIDFIYMINLDERPEKYACCISQLSMHGIHPYRFSAVNGWELSLEALNELGVKFGPWMEGELWGTAYLPEEGGIAHHEILHVVGRNYFCHCMARGSIGI